MKAIYCHSRVAQAAHYAAMLNHMRPPERRGYKQTGKRHFPSRPSGSAHDSLVLPRAGSSVPCPPSRRRMKLQRAERQPPGGKLVRARTSPCHRRFGEVVYPVRHGPGRLYCGMISVAVPGARGISLPRYRLSRRPSGSSKRAVWGPGLAGTYLRAVWGTCEPGTAPKVTCDVY